MEGVSPIRLDELQSAAFALCLNHSDHRALGRKRHVLQPGFQTVTKQEAPAPLRTMAKRKRKEVMLPTIYANNRMLVEKRFICGMLMNSEFILTGLDIIFPNLLSTHVYTHTQSEIHTPHDGRNVFIL